MIKSVYNVEQVPHPSDYRQTLLGITGPGIAMRPLLVAMGATLDNPLPADKLEFIAGLLNYAYVVGRRSAQAEVRQALGIVWTGNEFSLRWAQDEMKG